MGFSYEKVQTSTYTTGKGRTSSLSIKRDGIEMIGNPGWQEEFWGRKFEKLSPGFGIRRPKSKRVLNLGAKRQGYTSNTPGFQGSGNSREDGLNGYLQRLWQGSSASSQRKTNNSNDMAGQDYGSSF